MRFSIVQKYPSLPLRDNPAIQRLQWEFFDQAAASRANSYYSVVASGDVAYPFGVSRTTSHLEAREFTLQAHSRLGLPPAEAVTVVGFCPQENCTCCNLMFALRSERMHGWSGWFNSEHPVFGVTDPLPDREVVSARDHLHVPLWLVSGSQKKIR